MGGMRWGRTRGCCGTTCSAGRRGSSTRSNGAVKCFVHEPRPEDLNEGFRDMLVRVEERHAEELL
eukprot:2513062-Rhodomonas_salina.2